MADKKISALTELTTPADGDKIPIVDVSDTTQAASGTTKFIQKSNLITSSGGGVWTELESVTLSGQNYVDFTGDGGVTYDGFKDTNFSAFQIVAERVKPSTATNLLLRVLDNGTLIQTGYRNYARHLWSNNAEQNSSGSNDGQGYFSQKNGGITASEIGFNGVMTIPRFADAINACGWFDGIAENANLSFRVIAGWMHDGASYTDIQGVRVYSSIGNLASGNLKLLGLAA